MSERLEEPKTEEVLPELIAESAPEEPNVVVAPVWSCPSWLRLAYAFQFLIAVIAVFTVWSQVGGQGHLDMLPWYTKLVCVLTFSWCCVRFTAAVVEHQHAWNRSSMFWLFAMTLVGIVMGGIVYYYHLHEAPDDSDPDDTTATTVIWTKPAACQDTLGKISRTRD